MPGAVRCLHAQWSGHGHSNRHQTRISPPLQHQYERRQPVPQPLGAQPTLDKAFSTAPSAYRRARSADLPGSSITKGRERRVRKWPANMTRIRVRLKPVSSMAGIPHLQGVSSFSPPQARHGQLHFPVEISASLQAIDTLLHCGRIYRSSGAARAVRQMQRPSPAVHNLGGERKLLKPKADAVEISAFPGSCSSFDDLARPTLLWCVEAKRLSRPLSMQLVLSCYLAALEADGSLRRRVLSLQTVTRLQRVAMSANTVAVLRIATQVRTVVEHDCQRVPELTAVATLRQFYSRWTSQSWIFRSNFVCVTLAFLQRIDAPSPARNGWRACRISTAQHADETARQSGTEELNRKRP